MNICSILLTASVAVSQPNVVMILADDQDTRLGPNATTYTDIGSLESQPKLRRVMMDGGVRMENYFVQTPICCPSRTEFFTGRYFHNIRGKDGQGCMCANTTSVHLPGHGIFGIFKDAGYETGIFGKTTNDQQQQLDGLVASGSVSHIDSPLDYNDYECLTYYRYFKNGTKVMEQLDPSNPKYGTTYQTSQIGNRTADWLDSLFKDVAVEDRKPFFLYLGPHAPHFPATPAPWYEGLYPTFAAPVTPNYNISSPDKTNHIRQNPPLTDLVKCWEDQHFRDRWRTLASVDDLVQMVFDKLHHYNEFDNTYFIYTSDHGYKLGQWRVGTSKQHPYETDIRIPFLISGPNIPKGKTFSQLTGSVDLLPTILDIVDIPSPKWIDGRSFAGLLVNGKENHVRDIWLTEYEASIDLWNDHSKIWAPSSNPPCAEPIPRGPAGNVTNCVEATTVGGGNCYYIDSKTTNTWRALRILNATHNVQYIEYDYTWTFNSTSIQYHELYNLTQDPYQIKNLYPSAAGSFKESLHHELVAYFECSGADCP
eukprot:TRINITY_DN1090_c10_g1_i1.p1 TRINITY_DN1090_c10_g1~~TRINITY_DN1090_c10_g1_i1.p1  ORF type:complete len:537 (+),score=63.18 TRINITY_DN1090_c10_g1_i1:67-1677(+)